MKGILIFLIMIPLPIQALTIPLTDQNQYPIEGSLSWYALGTSSSVDITKYCSGSEKQVKLLPNIEYQITCNLKATSIPGTIKPLMIYGEIVSPDGKVTQTNKYFVPAMCDSDQSICGWGNFCFLTDEATKEFNSMDKMKAHVGGDFSFSIIDKSKLKQGCLPNSAKQMFTKLTTKSVEEDCSKCGTFGIGCNKETCWGNGKCMFSASILGGECKKCQIEENYCGCPPTLVSTNVDPEIMYGNVANLHTQITEYGKNSESAEWIKQKLIKYGIENVHFEDFDTPSNAVGMPVDPSIKNVKGRNVVGEIGGGSNIVIIGAHRDGPGSVDNAAGVATILETARIFGNCKNEFRGTTLRFVLFDGEERGLLGSEAYYKQHRSDHNLGFINVDELGDMETTLMHFGARSPTSSNGIASGPYADPTKEACQALDIPCLEDGLYINTDSYTFDKGGLAVLDISGYIENDPKYTLFAPTFLSGNYIIGTRFQHGPQDNLARINKEKLAWGPRLLTFVISDMYD